MVTPPLVEYISCHSVFSVAAAETLKLFTGSDSFGYGVVIPAGSSKVQREEDGFTIPAKVITLYWATFTDAADEAGISRRFGGIHFIDGGLESRKLARIIGQNAWKKTQRLFNQL